MDKISENPGKKPNKYVTRSFILPVKPFVAKFLMANTETQIKIIDRLYPLNNKSEEVSNYFLQVANIRRRLFFYSHLYSIQYKLQLDLKISSIFFIDYDYLEDSNINYSFKYIKTNTKCSDIFSDYLRNGFQLIKVIGEFQKVKSKSQHSPFFLINPKWAYDFVNRGFERHIMESLAFHIHARGNKTIQEVLDEFYQLFNLSESDIKRSTIIKFYQRKKDSIPLIRKREDLFLHSFHKKFSDEILISYYRMQIDGKITIGEIAEILNVSSSTIENIFRKYSSILQKKL